MTSLGFIIGSIVAAVLVLVGVVLIVLGSRMRRSGNFDMGEGGMVLGAGIAVLAVTAVATAWVDYPYDMQYHRYVKVQGSIAAIEARMLADGHGTTQNFAVRFAETGDTYRCDDTRCSLLHTGDWLSLWCIRDWQYASQPGWDCNYDDSKVVSK